MRNAHLIHNLAPPTKKGGEVFVANVIRFPLERARRPSLATPTVITAAPFTAADWLALLFAALSGLPSVALPVVLLFRLFLS